MRSSASRAIAIKPSRVIGIMPGSPCRAMRARASNSRELITAASWSGSTLHLLIAVTDGVNAERLEGLGRPIGEDGFAVDVSVAVDQLSGAWLVASGKFSLIASTF